ncbi:MAG: RDD family protein [Patescibacteria group bacterium]
MTKASAPQIHYAHFGTRFLAFIFDIVFTSVLSGTLLIFIAPDASPLNPFPMLFWWGYLIFTDVHYGYSVGKRMFGLKVVNKDTGEKLNYFESGIRESIGRMLSSIVLGIGYLWMLFDKNKQTWHDKLSNSIVITMEA